MQRPPVEQWREYFKLRADDARHIVTACAWIAHVERQRDDLLAALELSICQCCENRIGWNGEHNEIQRSVLGRTDWRKCPCCKKARAAIASVEGSEGSQDA